jgi:hypothetical protein
MAERQRKDWRELCAAAAEEPDPGKLVSLVRQIIQAIDRRGQRSLPPGVFQRVLSGSATAEEFTK